MRMFRLFVIVSLVGTASSLFAAESAHKVIEDTAEKAHYVVAGTILDEPIRQFDKEKGTASYRFRIGTVEYLLGPFGIDSDREKEKDVTVERFEAGPDDRPLFLEMGTRIILFLDWNNSANRYTTVDPWFGAQRYSESLAKTTKRVATQVWQRRGLSRMGIEKFNTLKPIERALRFVRTSKIDVAKFDLVRAMAFSPASELHVLFPNVNQKRIEWLVVIPPHPEYDLSVLSIAIPALHEQPWRLDLRTDASDLEK